jgi:hypothetical protein
MEQITLQTLRNLQFLLSDLDLSAAMHHPEWDIALERFLAWELIPRPAVSLVWLDDEALLAYLVTRVKFFVGEGPDDHGNVLMFEDRTDESQYAFIEGKWVAT